MTENNLFYNSTSITEWLKSTNYYLPSYYQPSQKSHIDAEKLVW